MQYHSSQSPGKVGLMDDPVFSMSLHQDTKAFELMGFLPINTEVRINAIRYHAYLERLYIIDMI